MINLKNIKNQKNIDIKLVEILFYTFPVSFIIGNLILSAHLLLFIILSLVLIINRNLIFEINKLNFIPIIFFVYLFLSTAIQFPGIFDVWVEIKNLNLDNIPLKNDPIFKSFLLIRFILLVIIIDILFSNKLLNLKKLFIVSLFCTSFVSLDIIFQYFLGFDIFGIKNLESERYTGPFGDEAIAGSYIQKFSLLSFFSFYFLNIKKNNTNKFLLFFTIVVHSVAIFLAGNRMPMLMFLFGCFLVFLLVKNFRLIMSLSITTFVLIFFILISNNQIIKTRYVSFFEEINIFKHVKIKIDETKPKKETKVKSPESHFLYGGHGSIYKTSIYMWKTQPLFGYGLKSFRFKCWEILAITNDKKYSCSNHSHNYYFELLAETGILGIFLIFIFFIIILKNSYTYLNEIDKKKDLNFYLLLPIFITFLIEIFPLKSTGSFFTTWNATFIWIIIAILYAMTCNNKIK